MAKILLVEDNELNREMAYFMRHSLLRILCLFAANKIGYGQRVHPAHFCH